MEDPASASRRNEQRGLDEKSPDDPVYPVKSGSRGRSPFYGKGQLPTLKFLCVNVVFVFKRLGGAQSRRNGAKRRSVLDGVPNATSLLIGIAQGCGLGETFRCSNPVVI